MILVTVRHDDALDLLAVLEQIRNIGNHKIDPEHILIGECHAAVDDDDGVLPLQHGHILPDLAEPAEGNDAERRVGASALARTTAFLGFPPVGDFAADRCCRSNIRTFRHGVGALCVAVPARGVTRPRTLTSAASLPGVAGLLPVFLRAGILRVSAVLRALTGVTAGAGAGVILFFHRRCALFFGRRAVILHICFFSHS